MAFNKLFSYAEADIPRRSGHDEFHRHAFTLTPGTLTPTFWDFVVPGDIVSVAPKFELQLPPQATDYIGRINLRTELFYVPMRTLWAGWKDFITYPSDGLGGPAPDDPAYHSKYIPGAILTGTSPIATNPSIIDFKYYRSYNFDMYQQGLEQFFSQALDRLSSSNFRNSVFYTGLLSSPIGPCSLMDYLGFKVSGFNTFVPEDLRNQFISTLVYYFQATAPDILRSNAESDFENLSRGRITPLTSGIISLNSGNRSLKFSIVLEFDYSSGMFTFYSYIYNLRYFINNNEVSSEDIRINNVTIPFAYHKIYNDWYIDKRVMKPLLPHALNDSPAAALANIAYMPKCGGGFSKKFYEGDNLKFYDGKSVFDLRQRLWQKDYFTTMTTQPQSGDASAVTFDTSGDTGEFTISSLRVANAMQLWRERNNLVDPEYADVMYAQYGVYPDDSITGKAIYLGSSTQEVYNKAVYQQGEFSGSTNNPINSVGAKYASPIAVGGNSLCDDYHIREHGIIMAITSLVPEAMYSTGTRRQFHYDTIDDIAFPLLQGVGDQPVFAREIVDTYSGAGDETVIGYQQRYTEYRFIQDNVSGLLRDGQSLDAYALQRSFSEVPELGSEFLEIPKDYLDQVSAVGIENSKFGAWVSSAWDYRKASRFSALNSMPTLGHMKDTETIRVEKAGKRL